MNLNLELYNVWQEEYIHEAYRYIYLDGKGNAAEVAQFSGGVVKISATKILTELTVTDGFLEGCDFTIEQAKTRALFLLSVLAGLPEFGRRQQY